MFKQCLHAGQRISRDRLWLEFFSDPSQWWDNRFDKKNQRTPDFRHKYTKEALWIEDWLNPPWVKGELATMIQGQAECSDMRTLCTMGRLKEALHILSKRGKSADSSTYALLLQGCINMQGLVQGKQVHAHIIQTGFKPNIFLLNTIINMYAKCGSLVNARLVFDKMPEREMFTWNILMAAYVRHGCGRETFEIYEQMIQEGVTPNMVTFNCVLKACASLAVLEKGLEIHTAIMTAGIAPDTILQNTLIDMYAKCGSMKDARQVFDNMVKRDVVSWSAMIAGYAQHGCGREAFEMYEQMIKDGVTPDNVAFVCILNACASLGVLEKGKDVHAAIIKAGIAPDIILETALADMYAKCGSMKDARQVFDNMAQRNVVSWNAMIAGYAQHGCGKEALELLEQMQQEDLKPNVSSWNAMIAGFAHNGRGGEAFDVYERMTQEGVTPNKVTYICILKASASLAALDKGKEVHADLVKAGVVPDIIFQNMLVDMYAKCGSIADARQVFDDMAEHDVISWNTMIAGYAQHGCGRKALQLFEQMQQEGSKPNSITITGVLSACNHVGLVDEGSHYFENMNRDHGLTPSVEHFSCMVDLLGRAGRLDEAESLVHTIQVEPGGSVWGALFGACRIYGNVELAERMVNCLLKLDTQDPPTSVLPLNNYAAAGRWDHTAQVKR